MASKILLATTVDWPFAARLAAGFAQVSCMVEALAPRDHVLGKSRYLAAHHIYHPLLASRALASAIARAKPDLVVPCDDRAVTQMTTLWRRAIAKGDDRLRNLIETSLGNPSAYARLLSRTDFIAAAREDGILAPEMRAARNEDEFESHLSALGLPLAVKADGTWGGDGVALAMSREQARGAWRRLSRTPSRLRSFCRAIHRDDLHHVSEAIAPVKPRVGVQAYIEGKPATSTFACWRGEVLAALHFDVVTAEGTTKPASVLRRVEDPAMDEAARRIARRHRLSGLHGLDFVRDRDGRAHLIEINPRATPTSHLAFGESGDLPAALAAALAKRKAWTRPAVTEQRTVALFPQEWMRDPKSPHLVSAYHDVPWDDRLLLQALVGKTGAQALAEGTKSPGIEFTTETQRALRNRWRASRAN